MRTFFNYPISLSVATIRGLGLFTTIRVGISYIWSRIFPVKNEKTLEDFFINRFGKELYETFFKDYTEKVWGVSCKELGAQWGAQRIKGLSISKAISHALKSSIRSIFPAEYSLTQKNVETSLIERFLYPKFGPGQMWELVAEKIIESGGELHKNIDVKKILIEDQQVVEVHSCSSEDNSIKKFSGDFYFSTMPIKDLVSGIEPPPPDDISRLASGLVYRDFMTVGVLLSKLKVKNSTSVKTSTGIIPDNWIYIQEKDVKVGRIQVFNNWSPYMVADSSTVWLGLEYFCNEGDDMWSMEDSRFIKFAVAELEKLGFCDTVDVLDATVIRIPKTYPAYTGTYDSFEVLKRYIDTIENLFLIGRNGMHRYNNQDHSMLTAMVAVDNIISGIQSKDNIWAVNTEDDYHEEK